MTTKLMRIAAVAALAVGVSMAQTTTPAPNGGHKGGPRAHMQQMATQLGLTDDQKAQAKEIFQASRESSAPLRQQMHAARQQLASDVKSGASQDLIAKDSSQVGSLAGQLAATRAQTFQKFVGILTPDQKAKLDTMRPKRRARMNG